MTAIDPLSDVLRVLRIDASLVLNDTYPLPWKVRVPPAERLATLTGGAPDRTVAFHHVQHGNLHLERPGHPPVEARTGDLLVCFGGDGHDLTAGRDAHPTPLEDLMVPQLPRTDTPPAAATLTTTLLCGVFSLNGLDLTPLAKALPDVVAIPATTPGIDTIIEALSREVEQRRPGWIFSTSRLLELLCTEAVRYVARDHDHPTGWFRALDDTAVFAAMSAVHDEPQRNWDVDTLADVAALSPSRLTVRFRETLGVSPKAYVTEWRMALACRLLTDTDHPVRAVAQTVGYPEQSSFTRAFTRRHGCSPRTYRTRRQPTPAVL